LPGATDRAIKVDRFALRFQDVWRRELIEHDAVALVEPGVFGIALSYEGVNDQDRPRYDSVMALLVRKLQARRVWIALRLRASRVHSIPKLSRRTHRLNLVLS
jgi:hypothetical protein